MSHSFINFDNENSRQRGNLVEFRAGKMIEDGKQVRPIKERKGLLYLRQTEDSLIHFCWKDRESGQVDDDFVLFPNQVEFKRVNQCKTGRVYMLRFKESPMRHFYWMQEPKEDKDEEYATKINHYINNPPVLRQDSDEDISSLITESGSQEDNPEQLVSQANMLMALSQALNEVLRQNPHIDPNATHGPPHTITLNELQNAINFANQSNTPQSSRTSQPTEQRVQIDLCDAFTSESLNNLQSNESFTARINDFLPYDSDSKKRDDFLSTVKSPQFQYSLRSFSKAFQTCHLTDLIRQFGLSQQCIDAAIAGDFTRFAAALQNSSQNRKTNQNNKKN